MSLNAAAAMMVTAKERWDHDLALLEMELQRFECVYQWSTDCRVLGIHKAFEICNSLVGTETSEF